MSHSGENYFHTDDPRTLTWLQGVISTALSEGQSVRLYTNSGGLMVKRGGGGWSGVIDSTPDAFRDAPCTFESDPS